MELSAKNTIFPYLDSNEKEEIIRSIVKGEVATQKFFNKELSFREILYPLEIYKKYAQSTRNIKALRILPLLIFNENTLIKPVLTIKRSEHDNSLSYYTRSEESCVKFRILSGNVERVDLVSSNEWREVISTVKPDKDGYLDFFGNGNPLCLAACAFQMFKLVFHSPKDEEITIEKSEYHVRISEFPETIDKHCDCGWEEPAIIGTYSKEKREITYEKNIVVYSPNWVLRLKYSR
jgi:hypothetical protein